MQRQIYGIAGVITISYLGKDWVNFKVAAKAVRYHIFIRGFDVMGVWGLCPHLLSVYPPLKYLDAELQQVCRNSAVEFVYAAY